MVEDNGTGVSVVSDMVARGGNSHSDARMLRKAERHL